MKLLKKNQVIIYSIAVLLMVAGYLNYTTTTKSLEASSGEINNTYEYANTGDARLASSNDVVENQTQNSNETNTNNTQQNQTTENNIMQNQTAENKTTENKASENKTTETNSNIGDDYFAKSKLERDTMYSQMLETYEKVLNSSNSLETQKQTATQEITKINDTKNSIMVCENLLQTKGFDNSVIFVNGDSVSVIIGTKELKKEEVAQIQNIISRELKANISNIHISNK